MITAIQQAVARFFAESAAAAYVGFGLAGLLGAVVNVILEDKPVVLPQMKGHELHLGFVGNLIICVTVALLVDHNFQMAFFAALCGTATLRSLKARMEWAFQKEIDRLNTEE